MNLKWRLSHTRGYLALGMFKDARNELDSIAEPEADHPEVHALRVTVLHALHDWRGLRRFAGELVERQPDEPGWWVSLAFATRRTVSIEKARAILIDGERHHPDDPTIQFNLGCYACQLGDVDAARNYVLRSIALDVVFREAALHDEDLEPLRMAEPDLFR